MAAIRDISTGIEGFRLWPGALCPDRQKALVDEVRQALQQAPFYRSTTPGGRPFSVRMSNMGTLGWVSDERGYRYQRLHPVTGLPWPDMPLSLLGLWAQFTEAAEAPDACLINWYEPGARMGLHQDRDEADLTAPVLSISLGDEALFRLQPSQGGPSRSFRLRSGDICALSGMARLARHGIDRIRPGTSPLAGMNGRLNLTLRRAG